MKRRSDLESEKRLWKGGSLLMSVGSDDSDNDQTLENWDRISGMGVDNRDRVLADCNGCPQCKELEVSSLKAVWRVSSVAFVRGQRTLIMTGPYGKDNMLINT